MYTHYDITALHYLLIPLNYAKLYTLHNSWLLLSSSSAVQSFIAEMFSGNCSDIQLISPQYNMY
eukprot:858951-Prorocentrum_minimum.AAC.3